MTFKNPIEFTPLNIGCGITACDESDAISLINERLSLEREHLEIASISAVDDVSTLDASHVLPNMGNIFLRGIWFPVM
ncbi:hypothetical protein Q1W73_02025 [Asticcacaulis sp. ZE23SCel15]|uniref:hypothetical protein n=1 Tax=Asticcacaulis sp. ZE23SCel15 TaxID=3059027 RepID=UPI00265E27CF|nr:hypothetical protein [Asticcacaulis sp. ZE23SCel15]WKL57783.1 hypothetical protein Q1W73_02025 [Asticcacaulis sp. ZE23SCel15]